MENEKVQFLLRRFEEGATDVFSSMLKITRQHICAQGQFEQLWRTTLPSIQYWNTCVIGTLTHTLEARVPSIHEDFRFVFIRYCMKSYGTNEHGEVNCLQVKVPRVGRFYHRFLVRLANRPEITQFSALEKPKYMRDACESAFRDALRDVSTNRVHYQGTIPPPTTTTTTTTTAPRPPRGEPAEPLRPYENPADSSRTPADAWTTSLVQQMMAAATASRPANGDVASASASAPLPVPAPATAPAPSSLPPSLMPRRGGAGGVGPGDSASQIQSYGARHQAQVMHSAARTSVAAKAPSVPSAAPLKSLAPLTSSKFPPPSFARPERPAAANVLPPTSAAAPTASTSLVPILAPIPALPPAFAALCPRRPPAAPNSNPAPQHVLPADGGETPRVPGTVPVSRPISDVTVAVPLSGPPIGFPSQPRPMPIITRVTPTEPYAAGSVSMPMPTPAPVVTAPAPTPVAPAATPTPNPTTNSTQSGRHAAVAAPRAQVEEARPARSEVRRINFAIPPPTTQTTSDNPFRSYVPCDDYGGDDDDDGDDDDGDDGDEETDDDDQAGLASFHFRR